MRRDAYAVGELAQFQVCPLRYYLQRMTRTANYYRDPWQVQFLIQGTLLTYALEAFRTQYPSGVPAEEFPGIMAGPALEAALAQAKAIYTGFASEDWFFLDQQTRRRLADSLDWMRQSWSGRTVRVGIFVKTLRFHYGEIMAIQSICTHLLVLSFSVRVEGHHGNMFTQETSSLKNGCCRQGTMIRQIVDTSGMVGRTGRKSRED